MRTWRQGLALELCQETSNCGSTIALFATKPNLVLLTSWVSYVGNYILTVSLTDTLTMMVDSSSGWALGWLRSSLTMLGLMDAPSKVTNTLVGTGRSRVAGWLSSIIHRVLHCEWRMLQCEILLSGSLDIRFYISTDTPWGIRGHSDGLDWLK